MKDLFRVLSALCSFIALVIAFIPEEWTSLKTDNMMVMGLVFVFYTMVVGGLTEVVSYEYGTTPFLRVTSALTFIAGVILVSMSKANNDFTEISYVISTFLFLSLLAGVTRVIAEVMSIWDKPLYA